MYGFSAIFAPLGGAVADRFGVGFAQLVATTLTAASLFALLSPSLPLQIPGIAAYSVGRLFIFAMFFSNIGRRLGFTHYGALVGTGMLTSAVVSMLQYPLFTAGHRRERVDAVNASPRGGGVRPVHGVVVEKGDARAARRKRGGGARGGDRGADRRHRGAFRKVVSSKEW